MEPHGKSAALRFTTEVSHFLQFDRPNVPSDVWHVWNTVDDNLAARIRNVLP
jgi:hypothetical protein